MRSPAYRARTRRPRRRPAPGDAQPHAPPQPAAPAAAPARPAARWTPAPAFGLGSPSAARPGFAEAHAADLADEPVSLAGANGRGEPVSVHVYGGGRSLSLRGRTDATYDGGAFATEDVSASRATGCTCTGSPCVHVTGTLTARYSVSTTVTLPRASDYPDLTECQRQRVQHAIDTVLAPHEQEHVAAFRTYDGSTSRRFDRTLCQAEFNGAIQRMFQAEERARRAAAQAASDALDPFHFDVDLDCEEGASSAEEEEAEAAEQ
jgi:hypothetical protein